ncbi:fumarylacetoacetate hydrolase family protein [Rhizobium alvei]|jgi:2-keto-4-pentenoate hydratase/2-oxohepta-3-ene-1,7-dioic acid hydratase in catechol pathway|uniref:Fumarylacetoacetate hydrolase family protein n=1 Tax=Rhizobium alvei TaxID=1132659 RepID=A0ABT8YGU8_9HYPH|nr:fumarylacetoacetate hydrolase family protein [Rhizobium alvei]MDO6962893.1 fumarylacetoacetate hydrolase family protein [Rhizobium alvei]
MHVVRFSVGGAAGQVGILAGDKVIPLSALVKDAPQDMRSVIADWDRIAPELAGATASTASIPLASVQLLAPVENPEKILAIGLNYADHVEEARGSGLTIPTEQVWFCKQPSSVNAPNGDIQVPKASDKLDYEVEMVAIIGKGGRHISREDAAKHVFGYAVGNDVSVRDWQMKTAQWMLGKSFDTHAPFGPAIVTADEIGDPHRLAIKCYVNGELRQNSNTKHLIFKVWDQIAELSTAMTLKPGDVIYTGTPGGVGLAFKPPRFLKAGDVVRCEIEEIGVIENRVVAEA